MCGDLDLPPPAEEFLLLDPKELRSPLITSAMALVIEVLLPACVFRFGTVAPPGLLGRNPENWYADSGSLDLVFWTPTSDVRSEALVIWLRLSPIGRDAASDRLRCCT